MAISHAILPALSPYTASAPHLQGRPISTYLYITPLIERTARMNAKEYTAHIDRVFRENSPEDICMFLSVRALKSPNTSARGSTGGRWTSTWGASCRRRWSWSAKATPSVPWR